MHLIDDIDLIPAFGGRKCDLVPDLPYIVDSIVGSRVYLYHVHGTLFIHSAAHITFVAGTSIHRMLAVDCLGKYLGNRSLARSPCPAEKVGVPDPVHPDLIPQCCDDMVLPLHIIKGGRSLLAVKSLVSHLVTPLPENAFPV